MTAQSQLAWAPVDISTWKFANAERPSRAPVGRVIVMNGVWLSFTLLNGEPEQVGSGGTLRDAQERVEVAIAKATGAAT